MQLLPKRFSKTPQPAIFIIADISGYTRFMLSNRESLLHSQIIISDLIRAILNHAKIPLEIAKLEGDAVFMYCLKQGDRLGTDRNNQMSLQDLGTKLFEFMNAFMAKLKELYHASACQCSACTHLEMLRLKIVVHSGEALFYQLDRFQELAGPDVIIVHRLLKNSAIAPQYILLTAAAAKDIRFPDSIAFQQGLEHYDDIGDIETWLYEFPNQSLSRIFIRPHHHKLSDSLPNLAIATTTIQQWQQAIWFTWRSIGLSLGLERFTHLSQLSLKQQWSQSKQSRWMLGMTVLRWGVSAVLVLGGIKLAFPADPQAFAQSYIDPQTGFISPFFADQITTRFGISIARFLQIQGWLELVTAAVNLRWGAHTPMTGLMMGFMFWAFTIAHPVVGAISLSRDIALAAFCLAIALTGPGAWNTDGSFQRRNIVLLLLRLGLGYTFIASALFTDGVMANPLNTTIPLSIPLIFGLALSFGVATRFVSTIIAVWLLIVVSLETWDVGHLYWGLESVKREIALMVGAGVFAVLGRDRWSWPKSSHPQAK